MAEGYFSEEREIGTVGYGQDDEVIMDGTAGYGAGGEVIMDGTSGYGAGAEVIIEDDFVDLPPARLTFTTGIRPPKARRHLSEVYTRGPPKRMNSVPARSTSDVRATRRSLSRHGSRVKSSQSEDEPMPVEETPYSFILSNRHTTETSSKYKYLLDITGRTLKDHEVLTSTFNMPNTTQRHLKAMERIQESGVLLITGPQSSGKTHLAYDLILNLLRDKPTLTPLILESAADLQLMEAVSNPTIVLLNHCFGQSGQSCQNIGLFERHLKHVKRLLDKRQIHIIMTVDFDRFEHLGNKWLGILATMEYSKIDLNNIEHSFSKDEGQHILNSWRRKFQIPKDESTIETASDITNITTICQLFGIAQTSAFQSSPESILDEYLTKMETDSPSQYIVLLFVLTCGGKLNPTADSTHTDQYKRVTEFTKHKSITLDEAFHNVDQLAHIGLLVKDSTAALSFPSRRVLLTVLQRFRRVYGEECFQLLPLNVLNVVDFSDNGIESQKGNSTVIASCSIATYTALAAKLASVVDTKEEQSFRDVTLSSLWTNDDFFDTNLNIYGMQTFFCEDKNGRSLLQYFVETKNAKVISKVLSLLSQNQTFTNGILAKLDKTKEELCRFGEIELLQQALALSPTLDEDMLGAAIELDRVDTLKYCLNFLSANGMAIFEGNLLQRSCRCGSLNCLQILLGRLSPGILRNELRKTSASGISLIHCAAIGGDLRIFKEIEKLGCDLKAKTQKGFTVMHLCCKYGHLNLLRHIFQIMPELLNEIAQQELKCVDLATVEGHTDIVEFLIETGSDPDSEVDGGNTLSHIAALNGRVDILKIIQPLMEGQFSKENMDFFTPPQLAAKFGQTRVLKYFFENGINPMSKTVDRRTFLHLAAFQGHLETTEYLCSSYPELYKLADTDGNTILHDAAAGGNIEIFDKLVESGLDPLQNNLDGATVLHDACYYGKLEMASMLCLTYPDMVNAQSNAGLSPAVGSALGGHVDVLELLASHGADLNVRSTEGSTLLHEAAYTGKLAMVQYLMDKFPEMKDVRNLQSFMPMHFATQEGQLDVFMYLLTKHQPDLPTTDENQTLLHIATYNGKLNIVQILCTKCPNLLSCVDNDGASTAHYASRGGHIDVLEYLIQKGQDPRATTEVGSTLLHLAAFDGHLEMVEHLCGLYPDLVDKLDSTGHSSAHYAAGSGEIPVLLHILKHGIDPLMQAENGGTLLMKASYGGRLSMVKYLYSEYPALIPMVDNYGCTAMHYAACGGQLNVLKFGLEDGDPTLPSHDGHTILHVATYHSQDQIVTFLCNAFPELMTLKDNGNNTSESIARGMQNETLIDIFEAYKKFHGIHAKFPSDDSISFLSDFFCCAGRPSCFVGKVCSGLVAMLCCRRKAN